jgi:DNA polymerase III subunit delta
MKIAPKAAESFLASPEAQSRAILIYGPDGGLVRERAKRIRAIVLAGSDDPFAYNEFSEARILDDPARLADELGAISLLGGKRLIVIEGATDKLTRIIEEAAPGFHAGVYLVVAAGELPSRSSLRAYFEKEPMLAALACYRDEARDLQGVIRAKLEEAGVSAPRDVMDYLAQQLGNDRYVTYQEIEKIILFAGEEKQVSLEEAQALVDYNRDSGLDDIVSAVADRSLTALEQTLTQQRREGVQPVAYLRALLRYFNRLYFVRCQMATGRSAEDVVRGLKPTVFFRQVPVMIRHAQQWDAPKIVKAMKLLIEAELACKTSDLPPAPASHRKLMQVTQVR